MREYQDVFQEDPRVAKGINHCIETPSRKVVGDTWRCIHQRLLGPVKVEINQMLRKGVITESRSQWQSPIVVANRHI